jgi:hypothetical protein
MESDVVEQKRAFIGGQRGPVVLSVWDGTPSAADGEAAVRLLANAARTEKQLLIVAVLAAGSKPPPTEVRDALAKELAQIGPKVAALANVVEGEGFRAAATRGVLTGMQLVIRAPYPVRICVDAQEAATFLAEHAPRGLSSDDILRSIRSIRSAI